MIRTWDEIKRRFSVFNKTSIDPLQLDRGYFKAMGNGVWLAFYTNNVEDKEKEVISAAAHDSYIWRVNNGLVPYPELWDWHTYGTAHGKAEYIGRDGHVVYAIGTFFDTELGRKAEAHYLAGKKEYGLSHGFFTLKEAVSKSGDVTVYNDINTFEISTLPLGDATPAALFTSFEAIKEKTMPLSEKVATHLREKYGDELVTSINATSEGVKKAVEENALLFKQFADPSQEDTTEQLTKEDTEALSLLALEGQADLSTIVDRQSKVLAVVAKQHTEAMKQVDEKIDKLEALTKQLQEVIDQRPQSVADENNIDAMVADLTPEQVAMAKQVLAAQQKGDSDPAGHSMFTNPYAKGGNQ